MSSLFLIIFALCVSIAVNADKTKSFLLCAGKEELFRCFPIQTFAVVSPRYDVTDFYATPGPTGLGFKGPLWSPFRAMYNLTTWNMFISVPLFYRAIFKFRRGQELMPGDYRKLFVCNLCATSHQLGISETERRRRKESNHFTTQITFVAWLLEVFHKTNHMNPYFDFLPSSLALNSYFNYNKIPRSSG